MYVSLTYLKVKSPLQLFGFFNISGQILAQIKQADGLIEVKTFNKKLLHNYTLSLWQSRAHMLAFMRSGAHAKAMSKTADYASFASATGWEAKFLPEWPDALEEIHKPQHTVFAK